MNKLEIKSVDLCKAVKAMGFVGKDSTITLSTVNRENKQGVSFTTTDKICQCKFFVPAKLNCEEGYEITVGPLFKSIVNKISGYGEYIDIEADKECILTCGQANLVCGVTEKTGEIEIKDEVQKKGLGFSISRESFDTILKNGSIYADAANSNKSKPQYCGTICFYFTKEDDYMLNACSTLNGAYISVAKEKIECKAAMGEQLLNKQYIVKVSHLKALSGAISGDALKIVCMDTHIAVNDGQGMYIMTLVEGKFMEHFLTLTKIEEYSNKFTVSTKEWLNALSCATLANSQIIEEKEACWLSVESGKLFVMSYDKKQRVCISSFSQETDVDRIMLFSSKAMMTCISIYQDEVLTGRELLLEHNGASIPMFCIESKDGVAFMTPHPQSKVESAIENRKRAQEKANKTIGK